MWVLEAVVLGVVADTIIIKAILRTSETIKAGIRRVL